MTIRRNRWPIEFGNHPTGSVGNFAGNEHTGEGPTKRWIYASAAEVTLAAERCPGILLTPNVRPTLAQVFLQCASQSSFSYCSRAARCSRRTPLAKPG